MRKDAMCVQIIDHPSAWRAADLVDESTWRISVDDNHVEELERAVAGLDDGAAEQITREAFPLPTFGRLLDDVMDTLEHGRGFVVLDGIPVQAHTVADAKRLFFGLSTHLGRATPQNRSGGLLNDVMIHPNTYGRGYADNTELPFHTDPSDVLGLLCLSTATAGGRSSIASTASIHNHIFEHHRELLGLLYKEYCYDRGEAAAPGELPFFRSQIFGYFEGRLACRYYSRRRLEAAPSMTGIPLSEIETAALDLFEAAAADPAFRHDFTLHQGSLLLLSNTYCVHARTAFEDGDETRRRHLLRMALNPYRRRAFPPGFAPFRDGLPQVPAVANA